MLYECAKRIITVVLVIFNLILELCSRDSYLIIFYFLFTYSVVSILKTTLLHKKLLAFAYKFTRTPLFLMFVSVVRVSSEPACVLSKVGLVRKL